jgi:hypothetical protein
MNSTLAVNTYKQKGSLWLAWIDTSDLFMFYEVCLVLSTLYSDASHFI